MTRPKRLTVTQLAMELASAGGRYPRAGIAVRWTLCGEATKAYWLRVARRAMRLERGT